MNITTQTDCVSLTVTDSQLINTNTSVKLTVKINCDKQYILNYSPALTALVVLPTQLEMTNSISDGVYSLKLEIVKQDLSTYSETKCYLVDCGLGCSIKEYFLQDTKQSTEKILAYTALKVGTTCYSCDCTSLCKLYEKIKNKNCTDELPPTNDCGCN